MNATVKQIGDVLQGTGLQTIGALVFWTLQGVRIERQVLRQALDDMGLGAAVPRHPKPYALLAEAVRRVAVGRPDTLLRRKGKEWGVVFEYHDGKQLRHEHLVTLGAVLAEDGETVKAEPTWSAPEALEDEKVKALIQRVQLEISERERYYLTDDLSSMLVTMMQGTARSPMFTGLSLRERAGGLYFVHAKNVDAVKAVALMIETAAPACQVAVLTLTGDADNLQRAAETARRSITGQLAELRSEIGELIGKLKAKDGQSTERNMAVRAQRFNALKAQAELFADLLGDTAAELKGTIEAAREELLNQLEAV